MCDVDLTSVKRERIIVPICWQCPFKDRHVKKPALYQTILYRGLAANGHRGKSFPGCRGTNEHARLYPSP